MNVNMNIAQQMLGQMDQAKSLLLQSAVIQPAASSNSGISMAFDQVLKAVDSQQHVASQAMAAVDSGQGGDLADAMIESQKASVAFSALLQVRNKLTTAFDDVMRMPL